MNAEITRVKSELATREREFVEKEEELNWVYQQKLDHAADQTREKEQILQHQLQKLSQLQACLGHFPCFGLGQK